MTTESEMSPPGTLEEIERRELTRLEFRAALAVAPISISGLASWLDRSRPEERADLLVDLIAEHLERRASLGEAARIEEYVQAFGSKYPEFKSLDTVPADLVEVEFIARHSFPRSDHPSLVEYETRFAGRPVVVAQLQSRCFGHGRYVRIRRHEDGGFGRVWIAYDLHLNRSVAIKEPHPARGLGASEVERLSREARFAALLDHPAIVTVHELSSEDRPFYAMRLVHGKDFGAVIRDYHRTTRPDPIVRNRLLSAFVMVCDAIAYAHSRGVIHADLKPTNILLGDFGETVVVDWGLARHVSELKGSPLPVEGTRTYMAPERWHGRLSASSDVWSLGAILRQIVGTPSPGGSEASRPRGGSALEAIRRKAMADEPDHRYASAKDLGNDVSRYLAGERISAWREPIWHTVARWFGRRQTLQLSFAIASGLALAILASAVVLLRTALDRERDSVGRERDARQEVQKAHEEGLALRHRMVLSLSTRELAQGHVHEAGHNLGNIPLDRLGWEWRRMAMQVWKAPNLRHCIGSHEYGVQSLALAREGRYVVTAGFDGRVVCRDLVTGKQHVWLEGIWSGEQRRYINLAASAALKDQNLDLVTALVPTDDSSHILAATISGRLFQWDLDTGARRTIVESMTPILGLATSNNRIAIGSQDGVLTLINSAGSVVGERRFQGNAITVIRNLSPDDWILGLATGTVAVVSGDGLVLKQTWTLPGPIWDIAVAKDGRLAVAVNEPIVRGYQREPVAKGFIAFEEYHHGQVGASFAQHVGSLCWSSDGKTLLAGDSLGHFVGWRRGEQRTQFVVPVNNGRPRLTYEEWLLPFQRRLQVIASTDSRVLLCGHGGFVEQWDSAPELTELVLTLSPKSRFVFDPRNENRMWIAETDGQLRLYDLTSRRDIHRVDSSHDGITEIAASACSGRVATLGRDGCIRFWKSDADVIIPIGTPLTIGKGVESMDFSPIEDCLAVAASDGTVTLWDLSRGRSAATTFVGDYRGTSAVKGRIRFRADGKVLAISGPGPSCRLWTIQTNRLDVVENQVAGNGATALAWDPSFANRLVTADTFGRLKPFSGPPFVQSGFPSNNPIAGAVFSPSGDRFLCAIVPGEIFVVEHRALGVIHSIACRPLAADCQLQFDCRGRRLAAMTRSDGLVIWDALPMPAEPADARRFWTSKTMLVDHGAADIQLRETNFAIDHEDRVWTLLCKSVDSPDPRRHETEGDIILVRETRRGGELVRRWPGPPRNLYHALLHDNGTVFAAIRDKSDPNRWSTRLYSSRDGFRHSESIIPEHANTGGYLLLMPGEDRNRPDAYHFDFGGNYLVRTAWRENAWVSARVGRQGDGVGLLGFCDGDGHRNLVFPSYRYGEDRQPIQYLQFDTNGREKRRVSIRPDIGHGEASIAKDSRGKPSILLYKNRTFGVLECHFASLSDDPGSIPVSPVLPRCDASNHVIDADGRTHLAYIDRERNRICLASHNAAGWFFETIVTLSLDDAKRRHAIFLLTDSQSSPVVVLLLYDRNEALLRVFRRSS